MASVDLILTPPQRRQVDDIKDDRLSSLAATGDSAALAVGDEELADVLALVDAQVSTGAVEISEILMCAKCVGECKIF